MSERKNSNFQFELEESASAPGAPSAGNLRIYGLNSDNKLYFKDSNGNEYDLTSIIPSSGDYANTGITNESNVVGGTTADALNTLETRLGSTGSNMVISAFGRQGVVVGQTGDYQDTGITNTSNVVGGDGKRCARPIRF